MLTGAWPPLEVERGRLRLTGPSAKLLDPKSRVPLREYLKLQGRFAHLSEDDVRALQEAVDRAWRRLSAALEESKT